MIRVVGQSVLVACLAALFALQSLSLWESWLISEAVQSSVPQRVQHFVKSGAALLAYEPPHLHRLSETLKRPLFVENRKPPDLKPMPPKPIATPLVQPTPVLATLDRYRLLGVHLDGSVQRALIQTPNGAQHWISRGGRIDGWTLIEIDGNAAVLSIHDRRSRLSLYPQFP